MRTIPAKTIISAYHPDNFWFGHNYNMNIYKGCCHGCIYCDSRSDCYGVEDFDEVRVKTNTIEIIEQELRSKRRSGVICTGAMSDPYNPFEKEMKLTRQALELINVRRFGIAIATKSDLIIRDIDILSRIQSHSPVLVKITINIADDELCKKIEPNAPSPSRRFAAVKSLNDNGIFAGILLMPVLPFISDSDENIYSIVQQAYKSGAKFIYPGFGVTLRMNQRQWYYDKLDLIYPGMKSKYMKLFGNEYICNSPREKELQHLFQTECERYNILYKMPEIIKKYKDGYGTEQLSLTMDI